MPDIKSLWQRLIHDIRVEVSDEFDRNFERKAFFDRPWRPRRSQRSGRGSLLQVTGTLRRSIRPEENPTAGTVSWTSSEPYASIHNNGGSITVTARMKRYAWHRYYELVPHILYRRDGSPARTRRNLDISAEAGMWKAIALMKAGSKITIPQRQFIGDHPQVRSAIEQVYSSLIDDIADTVAQLLKTNKTL